jgi:hypothetical protein
MQRKLAEVQFYTNTAQRASSGVRRKLAEVQMHAAEARRAEFASTGSSASFVGGTSEARRADFACSGSSASRICVHRKLSELRWWCVGSSMIAGQVPAEDRGVQRVYRSTKVLIAVMITPTMLSPAMSPEAIGTINSRALLSLRRSTTVAITAPKNIAGTR